MTAYGRIGRSFGPTWQLLPEPLLLLAAGECELLKSFDSIASVPFCVVLHALSISYLLAERRDFSGWVLAWPSAFIFAFGLFSLALRLSGPG